MVILTNNKISEIYSIVLTYPRKITCGVKNTNVDDTTATEYNSVILEGICSWFFFFPIIFETSSKTQTAFLALYETNCLFIVLLQHPAQWGPKTCISFWDPVIQIVTIRHRMQTTFFLSTAGIYIWEGRQHPSQLHMNLQVLISQSIFSWFRFT